MAGFLLEIPSSCFDDTLERVTLTLPKSVITGIDAVSPNRSAKFTQLAKKNLLTEIISKSSCCGSATVIFCLNIQNRLLV